MIEETAIYSDLLDEELDDLSPAFDEEGDGQLYEHLRMEVDRGQEPKCRAEVTSGV